MLHYYEQFPRLIQQFKEFIELTETATVTYEEIKNPVTGKIEGEMKFNFYTTPEKYETSLKNNYNNVVKELEDAIADKYLKLEKLNFLSQHIIETTHLLDMIGSNEEGINHVNFSFTNLTRDKNLIKIIFTQKDVQAFLTKLQRYVIKLKRYLQELKHNLELTNQKDFAVPQHMLPNPNDSTLENPLNWFEFLIIKNGLFTLKNHFKPSEDDYGFSSYDEETEVKTEIEQDPETGEWDSVTYKFTDFLFNRVYKSFNITRDLMDSSINKAKTKKEIKLYISLWLTKLLYLKISLDKRKPLKKYEVLPRPLNALIVYLHEKYPAFCPKPTNIIRTLLDKSGSIKLAEPKIQTIPEALHPGVFNWIKGDPKRNSTLLYSKLNNVFIQDVTLEDFHKAFSGGYPEKINILWVDKTPNNLHVNKVTLLYLFSQLSENELIDVSYDDPNMFRKLTFIFKDKDGKTLENLIQSKKNLINAKKPKTYMKKEIDAIIKLLLT